MRLFLSSYGLGNTPDELSALVGNNKRTAIIMNSQDAKTPESRTERLQREIDSLTALGLRPEELDLRKYFGKSNELKDFVKNFGLVWVSGGNVIVLRKAFKQSGFDEIITDLLKNDQIAYGGYSVHAGKRVSVNKGKWDESKGVENDFAFHTQWLEECRRVLKPNETIWVSGTYHSIYQCGYAMQILGYKILNDISWFKPNASPNLSGRYFTASHETLIWARKDEKAKHTFNYDLMKNGDFPKDKMKVPNKQMRSVWSIGTPRLTFSYSMA